jgi:hypothetical protein
MSEHRKTLVRFVQDAIDRGATAVEEVHKSIADLPLRILEQIDLLREPAKNARRLQDRTLGRIYDVIRRVNERVGGYAAALAGAAERRAARDHAGEERRAAPHAASS